MFAIYLDILLTISIIFFFFFAAQGLHCTQGLSLIAVQVSLVVAHGLS